MIVNILRKYSNDNTDGKDKSEISSFSSTTTLVSSTSTAVESESDVTCKVTKNLPDAREYPGLKFILETTNIDDEKNLKMIRRGNITYYHYYKIKEMKNNLTSKGEKKSWYDDLSNNYHFQFRDSLYFDKFHSKSKDNLQICCSRAELAFAWLTSLNVMRYYSALKYHLNCSIVRIPNYHLLEERINELDNHHKMWGSIHRELDYTSSLLWKYENSFTVLFKWRNLSYKTFGGLALNDLSRWIYKLDYNSTRKDLTDLFIHLVYLIKNWNNNFEFQYRFKDLEEISKFKEYSYNRCEIIGIPQFTNKDL
ncbi:uncharacterized protein L201_006231 [Kwoniella dendrophila CBS 6074]|uniref:Uncharacterized protein n=1 Tax=Kwoniella dendrophila CBS 6074 TaxID=1295534 RepID=A0AAX4K3H5_9TREE